MLKLICVSSRPASAGRIWLVDLSAPPRNACFDPPALELLLADLVSCRTVVEHFLSAEDQPGLVLLRLDLRLRREARAQQLRAHRVTKLRLGQHQEVLFAAAHHAQRRDDARLRRQEERVAGFADSESLDVVRDHALQVVGSVGAGDAEERARSPCHGR